MDYLKFFKADDLKKQTVEGNVDRFIYTGTDIQLVEYRFPPHKSFPAHKHDDHEQMGYVVRGRMEFVIGNETRTLGPGEYYHAPAGVVHSSRTLDEESAIIDIFSPPRDDLR